MLRQPEPSKVAQISLPSTKKHDTGPLRNHFNTGYNFTVTSDLSSSHHTNFPYVFILVPPIQVHDFKFLIISHISHSCYMRHPSHPPIFCRTNNTCWKSINYEVFIMGDLSFPPRCKRVLISSVMFFFFFFFCRVRWLMPSDVPQPVRLIVLTLL
jgi:hypothetical protein